MEIRLEDGKILGSDDIIEIYKQMLTPEGQKKKREEYYMYLDRDCSVTILREVFFKEYGNFPEHFKNDEKFNPWFAYSFLKTYCGINNTWFDECEYQRRHANLSKVLEVLEVF